MPEIERKFVIAQLPPGLHEQAGVELHQAYLAANGVEVRVRSAGDASHELTIKGRGGLERAEVNLQLDERDVEALRGLAFATLTKTRYTVPVGANVAFVDVYHGHLTGLVVAEVEFATREEAARFDPPPWFGREVTDDPRYRNAALARADAPRLRLGASPLPSRGDS